MREPTCCDRAYLCGGDIECPDHGGFDVCCDQPDLHTAVRSTARRVVETLVLNDREIPVIEAQDLEERGLVDSDYNGRDRIYVRSIGDLDGRVLLHEILHALLRSDPQRICSAADPRHEDFVRMLTAGLHDVAGYRRARARAIWAEARGTGQ